MDIDDDTLLTVPQMCTYLNLKSKTLEAMRRRGDGPRFVKVGRSVRSRGIDVLDYLDEQTRESTTE